jgi:AraC-like DNA-binding protein/anti-sigma regulatory factor (Ser/Thr protein kinase)
VAAHDGERQETVMADPRGIVLRTTRRDVGCLVAAACGEVTTATVATLRTGLDKLLAEGIPVLLDVSGLRLTWAPAPEVFLAAVTAAGGWPAARLVLFGADRASTDRLVACRVAEAVPLAATAAEAAGLVDTRPARLARGQSFPGDEQAVRAARQFLHDTLARWELPDHPDAEVVATELAANAVRHAGTAFRVRLVLDDNGLRVSVRDHGPGTLPEVSGIDPHLPGGGQGLRLIARLSRSWGVLHFADGKAVWAVLAAARRATTTGVRRGAEPVGDDPPPTSGAAEDGRTATAVTVPRRRWYATADPEQAHDFLSGLYGEHTLRLSGSEDFPGFQLVYEGRSTNRFTVERLSHTMPFEGRFAPAAGLVVLHPVGGDLRVAARAAHRRVDPGDAVLVDLGVGPRLSWTQLDAEAVRLDPAAVALVAADLTGADPATVRFDLSRPVSPARAALWEATVRHLRDDVLPNEEAMASPLLRSAAFRHLVAALVEAFPNTALDALRRPTGERVAPAAVRRAERFMEEHAADDIALADVAGAARLGARGLQLAFRRHHDLTPLEYLRRVRLERAHRDLQAGNPVDDTVGAIASRWGFTHHGNFSAAYLRAYGHSPSVTLRS